MSCSLFFVLAKVVVVSKILSRWVVWFFFIKQAGVRRVRLTQRALDWWESARFQALCVA